MHHYSTLWSTGCWWHHVVLNIPHILTGLCMHKYLVALRKGPLTHFTPDIFRSNSGDTDRPYLYNSPGFLTYSWRTYFAIRTCEWRSAHKLLLQDIVLYCTYFSSPVDEVCINVSTSISGPFFLLNPRLFPWAALSLKVGWQFSLPVQSEACI